MTGAMPGRVSRWRWGARRGVEGCGSRYRFRGTTRECGNRELGTAGHLDDERGWRQRMGQSGGVLVVEDSFEQRRRFVFAAVGVGVAIVVAGADTAA